MIIQDITDDASPESQQTNRVSSHEVVKPQPLNFYMKPSKDVKDTPIELKKVMLIENEDSSISRERKSTFKLKKTNVPQIGTRRPLIIKNNFVTNSESSQNISG